MRTTVSVRHEIIWEKYIYSRVLHWCYLPLRSDRLSPVLSASSDRDDPTSRAWISLLSLFGCIQLLSFRTYCTLIGQSILLQQRFWIPQQLWANTHSMECVYALPFSWKFCTAPTYREWSFHLSLSCEQLCDSGLRRVVLLVARAAAKFRSVNKKDTVVKG